MFKNTDARAIARPLKRSAEASERRNSSPFRSAMSMLTFYINRRRQPAGSTAATWASIALVVLSLPRGAIDNRYGNRQRFIK